MEMGRAGEGVELGEVLHNMGVTRVMGPLELWYAARDLRWVESPKRLPGEPYEEKLRIAASFLEIRHVILPSDALAGLSGIQGWKPLWEGAHWALVGIGGP
jgi:hypothetical protein